MFTPGDPDFTTDEQLRNKVRDPDAVEILIDRTNYAESADFYATLAYDGYGFRVDGNKIVVGAWNTECLSRALNALALRLRQNSSRDENDQPLLTLARDEVLDGHIGGVITGLPHDDFPPSLVCDAGDQATLVVIGGVDADHYQAYLDRLTAQGFALYAQNTIVDNRFATLCTDDITVNVWYTAYSGEMRIVAEPRGSLPVCEEDDGREIECTPLMTLIGPENVGMLILFRLSDGKFVVVDGGLGTDAGKLLYQTLQEQASDPERIVIAAWIFTHSHQDHIRAFQQIAAGYLGNYNRTLTIEQVICNFPGYDQARVKTQVLGGTDDDLRATLRNVFPETAVVKAHPGYRFRFADMTVEVLGTHESYLSTAYPELYNACCLFLRVSIAGQTIMLSADSDATNNHVMAQMYGDYLKCDILQADHHGYFGGTVEINKLFAPAVVLYFTDDNSFAKYVQQDYNRWLINSPNLREAIVVGAKVTTLPLPYVGK